MHVSILVYLQTGFLSVFSNNFILEWKIHLDSNGTSITWQFPLSLDSLYFISACIYKMDNYTALGWDLIPYFYKYNNTSVDFTFIGNNGVFYIRPHVALAIGF